MAKPQSVVALFTGTTPNNIDLVGVTVDPAVARLVAEVLLERDRGDGANPVANAMDAGRRKALTMILQHEGEGDE